MLPPAEGHGQDHGIANAQGIAKMAITLGIMSAKEADVAIRRYVSAAIIRGVQNLKNCTAIISHFSFHPLDLRQGEVLSF